MRGMNHLGKCIQTHIQNVYNPRSEGVFPCIQFVYGSVYTQVRQGVLLLRSNDGSIERSIIRSKVAAMDLSVVPLIDLSIDLK